ncbi:ATP-binding protein [Rhodovulum marinum]|uniref:histidine kinase n=1 Tax=Rhodovulum marinum TaxID=320662 RepID=A0A4R2Q852_9RHOB|nr:ATP-binding protein [Rhodovulum marinum]TCP44138.1 signal transduction histidine kinase [Rhodovulum marinum]
MRFLSSLMAIAVVIAALVLVDRYAATEIERHRRDAVLDAVSKAYLEWTEEARRFMFVAQDLAVAIAERDVSDQASFEEVARTVQGGPVRIQRIELAPGMRTRFVYPLEGNRDRLGRNLLEVPDEADSAGLGGMRRILPIVRRHVTAGNDASELHLQIPILDTTGDQVVLTGALYMVVQIDLGLPAVAEGGLHLEYLFVKSSTDVAADVVPFDWGPESEVPAVVASSAAVGGTFFLMARPIEGWGAPPRQMRMIRWQLAGVGLLLVVPILVAHWFAARSASARQRLTSTQARLAGLARNLPGVVIQARWADGRMQGLLYISPKCKAFWGRTQDELLANPDLMHANESDEDIARFMAAVAAGVETGSPIYARVPLHGNDGTFSWLDFHGQSEPMPGGGHRIDGIFVDVTAEVAARAEARHQSELAHRAQKNESLGQLTGGVAHDFNNILAVIMGNLQLLREEIDDPDRRAMIDASLEASRSGAELTRSMLAFARRARLTPEPLDLNSVARQAKNWMRRALPDSIEIETSLLAGLWPVKVDAGSLESALLNLVLNARDAMQGHGKLTIETANVRIDEAYVDSRDAEILPGRYVMLAVTDTGTGISGETLEHMFEPFYTTKPPGAGSGVGLSMVQGFVKQSGGTVQVYTEPGQGTTFKLYFPASDEVPFERSAPRLDEPGRVAGTTRILLAEDRVAVKEVLVGILEKAGYQVVAVTSGDAALAVFQQDPDFDLVVTDIVMPGTLQGTGLAKALRAMRPDLPVVFMSGYAAEATVHGNGLRPEDIRLMKPVPKDDLLAAVRRALAQAGG